MATLSRRSTRPGACYGLPVGLTAAEEEGRYRQAIAAGHTEVWVGLGDLLAKQPGRQREAVHAYRQAIVAGRNLELAWMSLWFLLRAQPGREGDAKQALDQAHAAGRSRRRRLYAILLWILVGVFLTLAVGITASTGNLGAGLAIATGVSILLVFGWLGRHGDVPNV